jgi:hypothetical protein
MRTLLCIFVLAALAGIAVADVNVTGKWSGTFNLTSEDGDNQDGTAVLLLKQNGADISGTIGPSEDEQHAITKGRIEGNKITFETEAEGMTVKLDLSLTGDHLTGSVNAAGDGHSMKGKIDVTRAK